MKFTCTRKDMQTLLRSGYYKVPRFQRPYSWTREELDELWSDVVIDGEPGHFIGSIVAFSASPDDFGVVDGQQRLITVTILLCCLRNELQLAGHSGLADGLHAMVIERTDLKSQPQCVLQPETSGEFFYATVQRRIAADGVAWKTNDPEQEEEVNLRIAHGYLQGRVMGALDAIRSDTTLSEEDKDARILNKLEDLRDRLLRLSLIFVELEDEDDAYLMFETLNARGKDLRVSDLVKNHLAKHLRQTTKTVDSFKTRWEKIAKGIEGSSASITVNQFIHHHWLSAREYTSEKKLFKSLKKIIKKPDAIGYLNELVQESLFYRAIFEPLAAPWEKPEANIRRSLRALEIMGVRQPAPLLLSLISRLKRRALKPKHVADALRAVEVFHFQFTAVASQSSSGGISQMYAKHAREVREAVSVQKAVSSIAELKNKLRERLPAAEEFDAGFREIAYSSTYTRQRNLVRYILGGITRHGLGTDALEFEEMTIEHLVPQSDTSLAENDIANIGNLVLVTARLNEQLGTRAFALKKASLDAATDAWLDDDLRRATKWQGPEIRARANTLATLSREKIWKL